MSKYFTNPAQTQRQRSKQGLNTTHDPRSSFALMTSNLSGRNLQGVEHFESSKEWLNRTHRTLKANISPDELTQPANMFNI